MYSCVACLIQDSLHTAKQRARSVNTDTNRLVFTCVRSLSEQLKNHIPMEISRQAEMTAEKRKKKISYNWLIILRDTQQQVQLTLNLLFQGHSRSDWIIWLRKRKVWTQIQYYSIILFKSITRVMDLSHVTVCGPFKGTLQGKCTVKKRSAHKLSKSISHIGYQAVFLKLTLA